MSHLFPTYARWSITPKEAEGAWLTAEDGTKYLDFTSGIGVLNLGHRHPEVSAAVKTQLDAYWHTSNLFVQPLQEQLSSQLAEASGLDLVFFANSGAEANEAAIKLSRKATKRTKIVTCLQSFHGRTFATMSATGQDKVKEGYGGMLETFEYIPFNDCEALKASVDGETAAVMLEIVQGEGGVHCATEAFLRTAEAEARKHGALLIVDEIQTGIGRTGKTFSYQHFQITPDIITAAKGLGNGLPIGAMIGSRRLAEFFGAGSHGSTFGGNPISVAAAIAVMKQMGETEILQNARSKGKRLMEQLVSGLQGLESVKEIRGIGLMIGIELTSAAAPIVMELQKEGLLVLLAGPNVIRLLPPLTIEEQEMTKAVNSITETLKRSTITAV